MTVILENSGSHYFWDTLLYIAYPRIANLAGKPKVGNSELEEY